MFVSKKLQVRDKTFPLKLVNEKDSLPQSGTSSKKCLGIVLAVLSAVMGAVNGLLLKTTEGISPTVMSGIAAVAPGVAALPLLIYRREPVIFSKKKMAIIVSRSLLGTFGEVARFISFTCIPLGEASVLYYSLPLYSLVFGRLVYREPCGIWEVALVGLDVTGIFLVTVPSVVSGVFESSNYVEEKRITGIVFAILGGVFDALSISMLQMVHDVPWASNQVWRGPAGAFSGFICALFFNELFFPPCGSESTMTLAFLFLSVCYQFSIYYATYFIAASHVTVFLTLEIVAAFIFEVAFLGDVPTVTSVIGAIVVIVAATMFSFKGKLLSSLRDLFRKEKNECESFKEKTTESKKKSCSLPLDPIPGCSSEA
ncbi:solute carrier family 35 member G1-like [Tachypleus tridentatus]|uniref:solute carrier family 35 member G1-like n=1 Tax=Tachypleus tridentatus TaxID=6853 RepID=UPI003FCF1DBA